MGGGADPAAVRELMFSQMTSPVRWTEINENQYKDGVRTFYEVGPKGVLTKMLGQNLKALGDDWTGANLDSMEAIDESVEA